jgi:hypothetical protein
MLKPSLSSGRSSSYSWLCNIKMRTMILKWDLQKIFNKAPLLLLRNCVWKSVHYIYLYTNWLYCELKVKLEELSNVLWKFPHTPWILIWSDSELPKAGILGILDTEEHFTKTSRLMNILSNSRIVEKIRLMLSFIKHFCLNLLFCNSSTFSILIKTSSSLIVILELYIIISSILMNITNMTNWNSLISKHLVSFCI